MQTITKHVKLKGITRFTPLVRPQGLRTVCLERGKNVNYGNLNQCTLDWQSMQI